MPQRQKSKTKKQMKKSINSLWSSLQEEKTKHSIASTMIGRMKLRSQRLLQTIARMQAHNEELQNTIETMQNREEYASEITANLVKNIIA